MLSPFNIILKKNDQTSVVFNTLSGVIFELKNNIFEIYKNAIRATREFPFYKELDAVCFFERKSDLQRVVSFPTSLSIVISLSELCNLSCYYCFEKGRVKYCTANITSQKIVNIVEAYLSTHTEIDSVAVTWFGGEPLMEKEKIINMSNQLLKVCKRRYAASIISNGTLFDDNFISHFDEMHIEHVQITVDGDYDKFKEYKGGNDLLWKNLNKSLLRLCSSCKVSLRFNLDKRNVSSVKSYLRKLCEFGILNQVRVSFDRIETPLKHREFSYSEFCDEKLSIINYLINDLGYFREESLFKDLMIHKSACRVKERNSIVIDSKGNCHKCEDDIGNNSSITIDDMAACLKAIDTAEQWCAPECRVCSIFPLCKGECPRHWNKDFCSVKRDYITKLARVKYDYTLKMKGDYGNI